MQSLTFITSLLTFYLKGEISMDDELLHIKKPNTIGGFIPLGYKSDQIPVQQISTATTDFRVNAADALAGILLLIAVIVFFRYSGEFHFLILWGILFIAVSAVALINAPQTTIAVTATSGVVYAIPIIIFEREKAEQAKKMILDTVVKQANTNVANMAQPTSPQYMSGADGQN